MWKSNTEVHFENIDCLDSYRFHLSLYRKKHKFRVKFWCFRPLPRLLLISLQKTSFLVLDSNGPAREPRVRINIRISVHPTWVRSAHCVRKFSLNFHRSGAPQLDVIGYLSFDRSCRSVLGPPCRPVDDGVWSACVCVLNRKLLSTTGAVDVAVSETRKFRIEVFVAWRALKAEAAALGSIPGVPLLMQVYKMQDSCVK